MRIQYVNTKNKCYLFNVLENLKALIFVFVSKKENVKIHLFKAEYTFNNSKGRGSDIRWIISGTIAGRLLYSYDELLLDLELIDSIVLFMFLYLVTIGIIFKVIRKKSLEIETYYITAEVSLKWYGIVYGILGLMVLLYALGHSIVIFQKLSLFSFFLVLINVFFLLMFLYGELFFVDIKIGNELLLRKGNYD